MNTILDYYRRYNKTTRRTGSRSRIKANEDSGKKATDETPGPDTN